MSFARSCLLLIASLASLAHGKRQLSPSNMTISSKYFHHNSEIPAYFTCDGPNVSPQLSWSSPPGAQSFVLLMKDTSSLAKKTERIHWIGWDIQGNGVDNDARLPMEGNSDFEQTAGYRGPCPPKGDSHHTYSIELFALNVSTLGTRLKMWSKWNDVRKEMRRHLIDKASFTFLYKRGAAMVNLPAPVAERRESMVLTMNFLVNPSVFVKSDARSKREQISEIEEKLDAACDSNHYMNHPFPPRQISHACQYLLSEFEEAGKAFMHPKGDDRMLELCMQMTGVCRGYDPEQIPLLGREGAAEDVDEMGRRWVRQAKCSQGYKEVDGACVRAEEG
ncbi:hypothetical protein GUITHDRAFT_131793 [Guillardia theta CCMP2712]|uniref:Phosphatidylethanolamine-binding protein n=1 Tax=Guillardia theta (strain CCMP2712) TaxID=905079 RepID=L1K2J4_GUITC|nr:hypothetical protein GUITHDRAFT_131793 [Guillardia theta CCMP2712]EKX54782.1 hypothetical protein GUITHDRAFT_131793 [Guillardia theta CCMP2712]|eukprot:XP_005841762.1 hypothetical protein GUITHDRAFT_131793 [Guillardia theta CCMP2712]